MHVCHPAALAEKYLPLNLTVARCTYLVRSTVMSTNALFDLVAGMSSLVSEIDSKDRTLTGGHPFILPLPALPSPGLRRR